MPATLDKVEKPWEEQKTKVIVEKDIHILYQRIFLMRSLFTEIWFAYSNSCLLSHENNYQYTTPRKPNISPTMVNKEIPRKVRITR